MKSRVTKQGRVTIPKAVLDDLGVRPGDRIEFEIGAQGSVILRKAGERTHSPRLRSRFASLRGIRKSGMSAEAVMNFLRGYDADVVDPGFAGK